MSVVYCPYSKEPVFCLYSKKQYTKDLKEKKRNAYLQIVGKLLVFETHVVCIQIHDALKF